MKYNVKTKETFNVIGLAIQTSTFRVEKELGALWHKFVAEHIADKIPNKTHVYPIVLYYDYSYEELVGGKPAQGTEGPGDYYSCLIGCKVSTLVAIPVGMTGITVPTSKYALFSCTGDFPGSLIKKWKEIDSMDLPRTHLFDIESYKHFPEPNHEVDIFVGIQ